MSRSPTRGLGTRGVVWGWWGWGESRSGPGAPHDGAGRVTCCMGLGLLARVPLGGEILVTFFLKGFANHAQNFCLFFFFVSLGLPPQHMEVPRPGSCSCQPPPQPHGIQMSRVCDLHHSAARPGIEPASSWILGRFVSAELQRELWATIFIWFWGVRARENVWECRCLKTQVFSPLN